MPEAMPFWSLNVLISCSPRHPGPDLHPPCPSQDTAVPSKAPLRSLQGLERPVPQCPTPWGSSVLMAYPPGAGACSCGVTGPSGQTSKPPTLGPRQVERAAQPSTGCAHGRWRHRAKGTAAPTGPPSSPIARCPGCGLHQLARRAGPSTCSGAWGSPESYFHSLLPRHPAEGWGKSWWGLKDPLIPTYCMPVLTQPCP